MRSVYYGGTVFTGKLPLQEAFIVEAGRFLRVGSDAEILSTVEPGDVLIPLEGKFVCAGFNDSHMHLLNLGSAMEQCDLSRATGSLGALLQALSEYEMQHPGDGWLLGRGWNQDLFSPRGGMPTRWDLDKVTKKRPICIVRCCGHCLSVNSRALEILKLDEMTPIPQGGAADKDEAGRLTGVFRDTAMPLVQGRLPKVDKTAIKRMLRTAMRTMNMAGVTSCHSDDFCAFDGIGWQEVLSAFEELKNEGGLSVRVNEQCKFPSIDALSDFLSRGYTTGWGDAFFRIGPLKMLGDGSLGARTAYLSQPYADAPGEKGLALYSQEQFDAMIALAHRHGMDGAVHAIGDGILDRVLNAYEKAFAQYPRAHRSGVVHVQLTRPEQCARMQALHLHAYVQTVFLDYDTHIVHARAEETLAQSSYAFKSLLDMGVSLSNGTDSPVEGPQVMRGVQCAVMRQPLDGSLPPYRKEEALTVEEALCIYTAGGAYASYEEEEKGRILPGMLADFAVLSQNPFETAPESLAGISVIKTYLEGNCVYNAQQ